MKFFVISRDIVLGCEQDGSKETPSRHEAEQREYRQITMTLNLCMPEAADLKPKILVLGVGGAGGNAINNMISKNLEGVEFVVANTDAQALQHSMTSHKIQLGANLTNGLGAGARPEIGADAAQESVEAVRDYLEGCHMCFVTAGMGGGTGTGAAPVIAEVARSLQVLTVGVVTKPFNFEGNRRMRQAEAGIVRLQDVVDSLIVIPNQNLFRIANEKTTFIEAFSMADDVLYQGVKGVTDLIVKPGVINLDFSDIRAVMGEMGKAMMGTGEAAGENRAAQAAEGAISNPLLDEISFKGSGAVLINITGGPDMTLFEIDEAANRIRKEMEPEDDEANIIVGSTRDPEMEGVVRVSVVASGIDGSRRPAPVAARQPAVAAVESDTRVPAEAVEAGYYPESHHRSPVEPADSGNGATAHPEPAVHSAESGIPEQPGYPPSLAVPGHPTGGAGAAASVADSEPEPAHREFGSPQVPEFDEICARAEANAGRHPVPASPPVESDGLPEPAYRPRVSGATRDVVHAEDPQSELSPSAARQPGEPSRETMARLWDVVRQDPDGYPADESLAPAPARPEDAERHEKPERTGGFRLNGLISKMTGQSFGNRFDRTEPSVSGPSGSQDDRAQGDPDSEREQVEIPAFLRRQAN